MTQEKKIEKLIVFDTETTGTSSEDRIVSFGAVVILNREITDTKIELFFNPEREMNPDAAKITNISDEFLKDKPKFKTVLAQIEDFLKDADALIAHNAPFDIKFMNRELQFAEANYKLEDNFQIIDSLSVARKKLKIRSHTLDKLCDYYKINRDIRKAGHGALIDAELLAQVYLKLTTQQTEFKLEQKPQQKVVKRKTVIKPILPKYKNYQFKTITLTDEELALHNKIINELKNE